MSGITPKKIISVDFYIQASGREPVREWLKSLKKEERWVIGEDIKMVQTGWPLGMPLVDNLGKGLWEGVLGCQVLSLEFFLLCMREEWYLCMVLLKKLKKRLSKI